jgi:hypothetical protein
MNRRVATRAVPSRLLLLRQLCWSAVLSHEPMIAAICELAAADRLRTNGALMALCAMYRRLRDGGDQPAGARIDHEAAIQRLIAAIAEADTDDQWLDRVLADIVSLQDCVHIGPLLPAAAACVRDPGWVAYLTAVRATYFVLGVERRRAASASRPTRGLPRG